MITLFMRCIRTTSKECISHFCNVSTHIREVKLKLDAIYNELYGVLEGYLDTTAAIPEFLTPQRALEIAVKALKEHARRLNEVWQMSTQHCDWEYFNTLVGGVELVAAK